MRRRNERRMAELRKKSVGIVWIHNENSQAQSSRERRNDKAIHSKTKTCLEICSPRSCDDDVWNTGRTVPNIYNFESNYFQQLFPNPNTVTRECTLNVPFFQVQSVSTLYAIVVRNR
ncbi:hypothetical protein NECAME_11581 [Necator americanus]|uniref:Uncharacterized protein n=1 Tax=Necator americanus TaxID=51031 RepID=W2T5V5_NECAM|nr:hypothetical protein NECAME_11581 [Necator americanus]ETN76576.1 hypothetical protein NECAME_11581 [Necator americanus]